MKRIDDRFYLGVTSTGVAKALYSFGYRHFQVPWDTGPRKHLVKLVESGRIPPCKAIDLGSGTASNCIFLAQHGFEVTGMDFAAGAVALGRRRAAEAGVAVKFVEDDLTDLQHNLRDVQLAGGLRHARRPHPDGSRAVPAKRAAANPPRLSALALLLRVAATLVGAAAFLQDGL